MKILTFDPGKVNGNMAYSFSVDGHIERYGSIKPLGSITEGFEDEVDAFAARVQRLVQEVNPDLIVAERFQDRGGRSKGATPEFVNIQLGIIAIVARPVRTKLITPALWKNWMRRTYDTGKKTKKSKDCKFKDNLLLFKKTPGAQEVVKRDDMVIHQADSICMNLYIWENEDPEARAQSLQALITTKTVKIDVDDNPTLSF